eukprot:5699454-Prorocentrum_lima.AAC.1
MIIVPLPWPSLYSGLPRFPREPILLKFAEVKDALHSSSCGDTYGLDSILTYVAVLTLISRQTWHIFG